MKNSIFIILALFSLFSLASCKEDKTNPPDLSNSINSISEKSDIETFYFPDTVSQNTRIKGQLKYNRNLGNVPDSEIKERYIFFHIVTDPDPNNISLEDFDKFPFRLAFEDTIGDGLIEFETVFTQLGRNYLHGVVEDIYEIKNPIRIEDSLKVSIKETILTQKVFVIEDE